MAEIEHQNKRIFTQLNKQKSRIDSGNNRKLPLVSQSARFVTLREQPSVERIYNSRGRNGGRDVDLTYSNDKVATLRLHQRKLPTIKRSLRRQVDRIELQLEQVVQQSDDKTKQNV